MQLTALQPQKKEIENIQTELDACSQLQTKCNGDLAKVTLERDICPWPLGIQDHRHLKKKIN